MFREMKAGSCRSLALLGVLLGGCMGGAQAQSVPPVVVSSTTTVNASGTSNVGKVVQDTCGNLYELENGGNLLEIPAGGGAAITLVNYGGSNADGLSGGLAIDASNNLYVGQKWSGAVQKIPSSNCVPNPAAATRADTSLGTINVYWYDPGDLATDAAGDLFIASNNCCNSNEIFEQTSGGTAALVLASNGLPQVESLAVDASGDVFFTVNGSGTVYEIPANSYGTAKPAAVITSGLTTALGISFDAKGNMYVGDTGTGSIYEVPMAASGSSSTPSLQFGSMFLVATGLPLGTAPILSKDGKSFFFGKGTASLYQQAIGSANFGALPLSSSASAVVQVAFNASVSLSAVQLSPAGGAFTLSNGTKPCTGGTTYTAGQSCTMTVGYSPTTVGLSEAGVSVVGANNALLAAVALSGIGKGAEITVDPGVAASVGSGFSMPESVAIDSAGDLFYADAGANAVLEFVAGSNTPVKIGSGLSKPSGVAVDAAGDVVIADTGNNRVVEVPVVNGALSNSAQIALPTTLAGTALKSPAGVAIDAAGDLYIADSGNNRVIGIPFTGSWNTAAAVSLGSALTGPLAVAVDTSNNLYIANSGAGQIYKIVSPFVAPVQQLVAVGFGNPSGLALDASGSLFVVDAGSGTVVRIPNVAGALNPNNAVEVGIGVASPYGVALDPSGNLYLSSTSGAAYKVSRQGSTLAFGGWALNTTSGALSVQVENAGNLPLTLSTPYSTLSGNTADFAVLNSGSGLCASGATIATGADCEVAVTFTPSASGARSAQLTLASNAAAEQIALTGSGVVSTTTSTRLAITLPASGAPFFGQPITLTATVSAASGTAAGSVTLLVDSVQTSVVPVNASGVATFNLASGLSGGNHTLVAIFSGASTYSGSVSNALQLSVSKAPSGTSLLIVPPYANPLSAVVGNTVTLTATVTSTGVGIPTGSVAFVVNGATLGSAPVLPIAGGGFAATLATTALPVGTDTISATYAGDANYIGSASASGTVIVVSAPQVVITASGTSMTAGAGASSIQFTATSYGGWTGLLGFSCTAASLPPNSRCIFSPGQISVVPSTPSASAFNPPVVLSLAVDQPPQTPTASSLLWLVAGPLGLLLLRFRRKLGSKVSVLASVLFLALATAGLGACGSGNPFVTPKGTSTITVNAWTDPFTQGSTSTTQPCGSNNPANAPCSQQTFKVSVTVQ